MPRMYRGRRGVSRTRIPRRRRGGFQLRRRRFRRRSIRMPIRRRLRSFRGRGRRTRKRFNRGRKGSFKKRLVAALSPKQVFTAEYGQLHTVPAAPTGTMTCLYWTCNRFGVPNNAMLNIATATLYDQAHLGPIFDTLFKGTLPAMQGPGSSNDTTLDTSRKSLIYVSGKVTYNLRNQSTETGNYTAYICKVRENWDYTTGATITNLYQILGKGFAQNGLDRLVDTSGNVTMTDSVFTPFQSLMFCQFAKIQQVKKFTIGPGNQKTFTLKAKSRLIRPDTIFRYDDADDLFSWATAPQISLYSKYQRFILFRQEARPRGIGATGADYNKAIAHTSPSTLMWTKFHYNARIHHNFRTPHRAIEILGLTAPTADPNSIINIDTAALAQEQDAE